MSVRPRPPAPSSRRIGAVGPLLAASVALLLTGLPTDALARRGGGFSRSFGRRSFGRRSSGRGLFGRRSSGRSLFGKRSSGRGLFAKRSSGGSRSSHHGFGFGRSGRTRSKGGLFGSRQRGKGGLFGIRRRGGRGRAFSRGRSSSRLGRGSRKLSAVRAARRARPSSFRNVGSLTRASRASAFRRRYRTPSWHFRSTYWGGSRWGGWGWGYRSVGMWDLFFLGTVSNMFWYHHWRDPGIQRALYQQNLMQKDDLRRLEKRVKELEAQGVKRDPNYLPKGVDADIAYSKEYVAAHKEQFEAASDDAPATAVDEAERDEGVGWFWVLIGLGGMALFFYAFFIRKY